MNIHLFCWFFVIHLLAESKSNTINSHRLQKRSSQSQRNEVSLPLSITSWLYRFPPWFEPYNPPPPGLHSASLQEQLPSGLSDESEEKIILPSSQPFNDEIVRTIVEGQLQEVSLEDDRSVVLEVLKDNETQVTSPNSRFSEPFLSSEALDGQFQPVVRNVEFESHQDDENVRPQNERSSSELLNSEADPHIGLFIPIVPNDDFEEADDSPSSSVQQSEARGSSPTGVSSNHPVDSRSARKAIPERLLPTSNLINVPKFPPLPLETSTATHLSNEALLPLLRSKLSELLRIKESPQDIPQTSSRAVIFPGELTPSSQGIARPRSRPQITHDDNESLLSRANEGFFPSPFDPSNIQDIITRIQDTKDTHASFKPSPSIDDFPPGSRWVWQS